jgi:hypothetical protein
MARTRITTTLELPRKALTIAEFCHVYGIGRTKYKELMNSGELTVRYMGRRALIDVDSAEHWYASLPCNRVAA